MAPWLSVPSLSNALMVRMGTISIQVTRTGAPYPLTKTYTVADADVDKIVAAYQSLANAALTTDPQNPVTATIAQVWLYVASTWATALKSVVQQFNTTPPVVPAQITLT